MLPVLNSLLNGCVLHLKFRAILYRQVQESLLEAAIHVLFPAQTAVWPLPASYPMNDENKARRHGLSAKALCARSAYWCSARYGQHSSAGSPAKRSLTPLKDRR